MITPRLRKPIRLPLLALVLLVSTCGLGDQLPATTGAVDAIPAGAAKIIKAPGASRYANIHCALRDRLGRLWFGTTSDGVYRYDGKSFVHFLAQDGLGNNTVHSIAEDQGGNIWFGTEGGIFQGYGFPVIVCGPGSIDQAHQPNEFVTREQLALGADFMRRVGDACAG